MRARTPNSAAQGQYVFTGRGFIEALDPGVPRMHYGAFIFDGAGKFSGKQSSSRGGKIGREKLQGTYTLDADCTGTMTFESLLTYGQIHCCTSPRTIRGATSSAWIRAQWPSAVSRNRPTKRP